MNYFTNKLRDCDNELSSLLDKEYQRQNESIELIASENYTSQAVLDCLGSCLTNKYSEGQIGKRYYGGNKWIDKIEKLCKDRALTLYGLLNDVWHVNVQPYSGSPANLAVYTALLKPNDRIMGLDLPSGGHLTHGFYTSKKPISASSIYFQSLPYYIGHDDLIDFEDLEKTAKRFKPKLIICGASAYSRNIDYKKFRQIANSIDAILMFDMAHISGIIAGHNYHGLFPDMLNPFEWCDIITTTTHKTLGGPRSGMIFIRKDLSKFGIENASKAIDDAVFPCLQGGPHNHQIAGLAYQLNYATTLDFKIYIQKVIDNSKILADILQSKGFEISTNGTDNHIVLVKLKNMEISGNKIEWLCEKCDISINKNCVFGDTNPINPSGIRIGTSAMTMRGFGKCEFIFIAETISEIVNIGIEAQKEYGKNLKNFKEGINNIISIINQNGCTSNKYHTRLLEIKSIVNDLARRFPFYKSNN